MRVLIVDDSKLIRQVIRHNLESLGVGASMISEAVDGADGIRKAAQCKEPYSLIITDLQMPNMDGVEFVKRLRTLRNYQDTRVVAISGMLSNQSVGILDRLGVKEFVKKPFDLDKFMATIKPIVSEIRGVDLNDKSALEARSEFIKSFQDRKPEVELKDGVLELDFGGLKCKITLDNFLKSAIFEK